MPIYMMMPNSIFKRSMGMTWWPWIWAEIFRVYPGFGFCIVCVTINMRINLQKLHKSSLLKCNTNKLSIYWVYINHKCKYISLYILTTIVSPKYISYILTTVVILSITDCTISSRSKEYIYHHLVTKYNQLITTVLKYINILLSILQIISLAAYRDTI